VELDVLENRALAKNDIGQICAHKNRRSEVEAEVRPAQLCVTEEVFPDSGKDCPAYFLLLPVIFIQGQPHIGAQDIDAGLPVL
jgi:hypothetical protein